jgi:hypothetical protein
MAYSKLTSNELTALGGAFSAGYESERATQVFSPEIAFSPRMDLSLALGWPFIVELDPPLAAEDPVKEVLARLSTRLPPRAWPVDLATRAVRLLSVGYVKFPAEPKPAALEAASDDKPFGKDEAAKLLGKMFTRPKPGWRHVTWFVSALEALGGGAPVIAAIFDVLDEAIDNEDENWTVVNSVPSAIVKRLAYAIRRLKPADAAPLRERANVLLDRAIGLERELLTNDEYRLIPTRALALLSNDEALIRAGGAQSPDDSVFLSRAAFLEVMRKQGLPEEGSEPRAQWVVAGGPEVLDIELGRWEHYGTNGDRAAAHAYVLEQYGAFKLEGAVALIADMAAKSAVKDQARAWLTRHRTTEP